MENTNFDKNKQRTSNKLYIVIDKHKHTFTYTKSHYLDELHTEHKMNCTYVIDIHQQQRQRFALKFQASQTITNSIKQHNRKTQ